MVEVNPFGMVLMNVTLVVLFAYVTSRVVRAVQMVPQGGGAASHGLQRIMRELNWIDSVTIMSLLLALAYYQFVLFGTSITDIYIASIICYVQKPFSRLIFASQLWKVEKTVPSEGAPFLAHTILFVCIVLLIATPAWFILLALNIFPSGIWLGSFQFFFAFLCMSSVVMYIAISARFIYFMTNMQARIARLMGTNQSQSNQNHSQMKRSIYLNGIMCSLGCISTMTVLTYFEYRKTLEDESTDKGFPLIQDIDIFINIISPALPSIISFIIPSNQSNSSHKHSTGKSTSPTHC